MTLFGLGLRLFHWRSSNQIEPTCASCANHVSNCTCEDRQSYPTVQVENYSAEVRLPALFSSEAYSHHTRQAHRSGTTRLAQQV